MTRRLTAELVGSLLLAAVVVGSGIAAQRLSPGDVGLQLTQNAAATGLGLFVLILMFAGISGAHFNPVVTLVDVLLGGTSRRAALSYIPTQIIGCTLGAVLANLMFDLSPVTWSTHHRASGAHWLAEVVATATLVLVIFTLQRNGKAAMVPAAVGAWIGCAYFFTSSTSFANPAITIGRMFTNTFAGIQPSSATGFIAAQLVGGAIGFLLVRLLHPEQLATVASRQDR